MKKILSSGLAIGAMISLVGCGGGSSTSADAAAKEVTGQFIDAAVSGLNYACTVSGRDGFTNALGEYTCLEGDKVEFSLGGYFLGSATAAPGIVTPYDIQSDDTAAVNVAQLLQTLDTNDTDDVITIPENFTALDNSTVELNATDFDAAIVDDLADLNVTKLVGEGQAQNSMDENILITLIEGKTYYTIGGDNDMALLSLEFNQGEMTITDVTAGSNTILDPDTYEIINDRLTTGSGEYGILVEQTADYIVIEKFTSGNVSLGEKTFYVDLADAEHVYWTLYGITQEKLDGKTFYTYEYNPSYSEEIYAMMTFDAGTLTRTEVTNGGTPDEFSLPYELKDGKIFIDVPSFDGDPAMYIWMELITENADSWLVYDAEDQDRDGKLDIGQEDTWYFNKPAGYPDFTVTTTAIDPVPSTSTVYQVTAAELSNQSFTAGGLTFMFNSNATGWDSEMVGFTWSINANYELVLVYPTETLTLTFSASPAAGSTVTVNGTNDYTIASYNAANWGSALSSYTHVFIYKNISQVTADQMKLAYESQQDFYALDLGAASAGTMSCTDLGFTTNQYYFETTTDTGGYGTVTSKSYMSDDLSKSCSEVDYAGLSYVGGNTDLALTYNLTY